MRKLKRSDVGRLCLVRWDDIGRVECMLLDHGEDSYPKVFNFSDRRIDTLDDKDQIVEMSNHYVTPNSITHSDIERLSK